jgi:hypothetical protein
LTSHGAIGASTEAKAGEIKAKTLVEQQTTPLASADAPAMLVETDDNAEELLVGSLLPGIFFVSFITQYFLVVIKPP